MSGGCKTIQYIATQLLDFFDMLYSSIANVGSWSVSLQVNPPAYIFDFCALNPKFTSFSRGHDPQSDSNRSTVLQHEVKENDKTILRRMSTSVMSANVPVCFFKGTVRLASLISLFLLVACNVWICKQISYVNETITQSHACLSSQFGSDQAEKLKPESKFRDYYSS